MLKSLLRPLPGSLLLLALALPGALPAPAQSTGDPAPAPAEEAPARLSVAETAQVLIDLAAEDNRVGSHLAEICNRYPHRLTGTHSLNAACDWAEARFRAMGLEAWQEQWGEIPVRFERGPQLGKLVAPQMRPLRFVTNAWTAGTDPAVGMQHGLVVLEPKTMEGFDAEAYTDRWILRRGRGDRPAASERRDLDAALQQAGALGELRDGGRNPVVGGRWPGSWEDRSQWVSVKLVREDYQHLLDLVAQAEADEQPMPEAAFYIANRFFDETVPQFNVIADIKGTEFPDEYVIVGGHIDDWDAAEGAQDNATGMATTFEAARLIMESGLKPRRTIRFMFWGGEEQGLFGSMAYARANPEVCANTSAVLVHDGGGNYLSGIAGPAALVGDLRTVFAPLTDLNPDMPFQVQENRGLSTRGASDHSSFIAQGVPGFFWGQTGDLDYSLIHHTRHDHMSMVNPDYQEHSAIVVAVGALGLANLDAKLDRTDLIRPSSVPSNRRTMGVYLEENLIVGLVANGQAGKLGLQDGDVIVAVDGVAVSSREEVVAELHKGDPKKTVKVQRGEEHLEVVFEWDTSGGR